MHAVIEVGGPDDITLIDLGNEPGTMVNGARVNKCKLHVGDQIQIGGTTIVLERAEAAGPTWRRSRRSGSAASGWSLGLPAAPPAPAANPFAPAAPSAAPTRSAALESVRAPRRRRARLRSATANPFAAGAAA